MHIKFTFSIRVQVSETRNYLGKPFPKLGNEFSMDMVRNTVGTYYNIIGISSNIM